MLYVLVRICKPATVVETGVFDGLSSAYILLALAENGRGRLISIDIRNERKLPPNLDQVKTGWLVPDDLRSRWELRIDDSKAVLPQVVDETDIDLFLHDSLHTERHMFFEFTTAINGMGSGSILLSDNIEYNTAFATFVADRLHNVCTIATAENSPLPDGGRLQRDKLGGGIV